MKIIKFKIKFYSFICLFLFIVLSITAKVFASTTDGVILPGFFYAWSNNSGWVNFGLASGNVHILNDKLTGYVWAANHGWINLAPTNGGVTNDGSGNLGGWAWGEQLGWINFTGVTIDSNGRFHGQATGNLADTITFDCDYCDVRTDWRPTSISSGGAAIPTQPPVVISSSPVATLTPVETDLSSSSTNNLPEDIPALTFEKEVNPQPPTYCEMYPNSEQCINVTSEFCNSNSADPRCQPLIPLSLCDANPDNPACAKPDSQSQATAALQASENVRIEGSVWQQATLYSRAAMSVIKQTREKLAEKLEVPSQPIITSTVAITGGGVAVASNAAVLYTGFGGLSELNLILVRFVQNLMAVLGLRRKRSYWGTVFDSVTKQPLDPVVVELSDAETGKKIDQAITDLNGRYGFLSHQGIFKITAQKTHYRFPSQNLSDFSDPVFGHMYRGEPINVTSTDVVAPNIPMDPLAFDWNQKDKQRLIKFHPYREILLPLIFNTLFYLGLAWTIFISFLIPSRSNLLCLMFYIIVVVIRRVLPNERLWGRIYDKKTKTTLGGLILELCLAETSVVISRAQSGPDGRFFLKAVPGKYQLAVYQNIFGDSTKTLFKTINVIIGKNGTLNQNLGV